VRRVAASPESIGGEGEELVPNAALLHNVRVSGGAGDGEKTEGGTPRWSAARPTGLAASERERRVPRWSVAGLVRPRRRNEKARIKHSFAKAWRKPRDDGSGARRARARGTPGEVGAGHGGPSDRDKRLAVGVPGGGAGAEPARDGGEKEKAVLQRDCYEDLCGLQPQEGRSRAPRIDLGHSPDRRAGKTITATRCGDELLHSSSRPKREIPDPRKKGN
jgi:hypothetical protein